MPPILSTRTIGVIGSGTDEHDDLAREVGQLLASHGVNLMTGGGRGVMTSVSRAFTRAPRQSGICIGIIPCRSEKERDVPKDGYPNSFVELAIYTHLPHRGKRGQDDLSRNHIIILSSAAIIALPGSDGTAAEVALATQYARPMISVSRVTEISYLDDFLRQHL